MSLPHLLKSEQGLRKCIRGVDEGLIEGVGGLVGRITSGNQRARRTIKERWPVGRAFIFNR